MYDIIGWGNLPLIGGAIYERTYLIGIAPIFVGLVIELVSHWLDEEDDN